MTRLSVLLTIALAGAGCGSRSTLPSDWNVVVILIDTLPASYATEGFEVTLTPEEREHLRSLGYVD